MYVEDQMDVPRLGLPTLLAAPSVREGLPQGQSIGEDSHDVARPLGWAERASGSHSSPVVYLERPPMGVAKEIMWRCEQAEVKSLRAGYVAGMSEIFWFHSLLRRLASVSQDAC